MLSLLGIKAGGLPFHETVQLIRLSLCLQTEVEPMAEAQAPRNSILDATAMSMEGRKRRYGDLGHLLPMSGNSRNVQVR